MLGYASVATCSPRLLGGADPGTGSGARHHRDRCTTLCPQHVLRPRTRSSRASTEFTILNLPGFQADPKLDGTASDCAVLVNFTDRIVDLRYLVAGEIKNRCSPS